MLLPKRTFWLGSQALKSEQSWSILIEQELGRQGLFVSSDLLLGHYRRIRTLAAVSFKT